MELSQQVPKTTDSSSINTQVVGEAMALPSATTPNATMPLAGTEGRTKRPSMMLLLPGEQETHASSAQPSLSIVVDAAAIEVRRVMLEQSVATEW